MNEIARRDSYTDDAHFAMTLNIFSMNEQNYFKSTRPKPECREQYAPLGERANENTFQKPLHSIYCEAWLTLLAILYNPNLYLLFRNRTNIDYSRRKFVRVVSKFPTDNYFFISTNEYLLGSAQPELITSEMHRINLVKFIVTAFSFTCTAHKIKI